MLTGTSKHSHNEHGSAQVEAIRDAECCALVNHIPYWHTHKAHLLSQAAIAELQQLLDGERRRTHQLQRQLAAKTHTAVSQVQAAPSQAAADTPAGADDSGSASARSVTDAGDTKEPTASSQNKADGESCSGAITSMCMTAGACNLLLCKERLAALRLCQVVCCACCMTVLHARALLGHCNFVLTGLWPCDSEVQLALLSFTTSKMMLTTSLGCIMQAPPHDTMVMQTTAKPMLQQSLSMSPAAQL